MKSNIKYKWSTLNRKYLGGENLSSLIQTLKCTIWKVVDYFHELKGQEWTPLTARYEYLCLYTNHETEVKVVKTRTKVLNGPHSQTCNAFP